MPALAQAAAKLVLIDAMRVQSWRANTLPRLGVRSRFGWSSDSLEFGVVALPRNRSGARGNLVRAWRLQATQAPGLTPAGPQLGTFPGLPFAPSRIDPTAPPALR